MLGVGEAVEDEVEDGIEEQEDVTVGWGGGRGENSCGPVGRWAYGAGGPMGAWAYGAVGLWGRGAAGSGYGVLGCWGGGEAIALSQVPATGASDQGQR